MVPNATTGELVRQYTKFVFDEEALEFIRPGDEGYAEKAAEKKNSKSCMLTTRICMLRTTR